MFDAWLTLSFIFLFVALILFITAILYYYFGARTPPRQSCQISNDCPLAQICSQNFCVSQPCTNDAQCPGLCSQGICQPRTCVISNDCPADQACVSQFCVPSGAACQSASDCRGLTCTNNRCVQCSATNQCPTGQECIGSVCRYPDPDEVPIEGTIIFPSPAIERGNIVAPPAYLCAAEVCGVNDVPITCDSNTTCPSGCGFCVNGFCRCTAGELYETCVRNADCASTQCRDSSLGPICYPANASCVFNYDTSGATGTCPIGQPYCVNGLCREESAGAYCAGANPADTCVNPNILRTFQPLEPPDLVPLNVLAPSKDMGFFCVNGTCQEEPGALNTWCQSNTDCRREDNSYLVCQNNRCIRAILTEIS